MMFHHVKLLSQRSSEGDPGRPVGGVAGLGGETLNAELCVRNSLSVMCSLPVNAGSAADTAAIHCRR